MNVFILFIDRKLEAGVNFTKMSNFHVGSQPRTQFTPVIFAVTIKLFQAR